MTYWLGRGCRLRGRFAKSGAAWLVLVALVISYATPADAARPDPVNIRKGGVGFNAGPYVDNAALPSAHLNWRIALPGPYSSVRPAVGPDGTIYVVDVLDNLFAVSPQGNVLWSAGMAGSKGIDVAPDGTVVTGNENWIKAFNPDGSLKWTFTQTPRAFLMQDVAVGPDGHIYVIASSGMGVFSLADTPGGPELRWSVPEIYGRPFVGYTEFAFGPSVDGTDQQLYYYANGLTRGIRLSDGEVVFSLDQNNQMPKVSPLDGTWHVGDRAYSPDGTIVWMFQFPEFTVTLEPSMGASGTHYAINQGRVLYAINSVGVERWNRELDEIVAQPDVNPAESQVIMATARTTTHPEGLRSVNTSNGSDLWRLEFPADPTGAELFVDSGLSFSPDGQTAYVMTAVMSGNGISRVYLNAVNTDPSIPSQSTKLRATSVEMDSRPKGQSVSVSATVTVADENRGVVSGALVSATWTLPDGSTVSESLETRAAGTVQFSLTGSGGTYRIDIDDIARAGYEFEPEHSILEGTVFQMFAATALLKQWSEGLGAMARWLFPRAYASDAESVDVKTSGDYMERAIAIFAPGKDKAVPGEGELGHGARR